jgi:hypothetical protein
VDLDHKPHVASLQPISKHHAIFSSSKNCLEGDERTWQYGMHQTRRSGRMDVYRSFMSKTEYPHEGSSVSRDDHYERAKARKRKEKQKEHREAGMIRRGISSLLVCWIDMIEMAWPFDHGCVVNVSRLQDFLPAQ